MGRCFRSHGKAAHPFATPPCMGHMERPSHTELGWLGGKLNTVIITCGMLTPQYCGNVITQRQDAAFYSALQPARQPGHLATVAVVGCDRQLNDSSQSYNTFRVC